ncbi:glycosyltransferase [Modestobacter sp. I12A-02628]|uniref:Glycosyltransferase family 2 protein n=1 Tax=Goekera deserti TaxID=2497753 RepID=A0A7K3WHR3_9ACTN|nr:glycosyltransferase family 2 protein [Goekera deserti]MPQ97922.1 glycosyltransferase [Goekera deserti]NDI48568.1 glycosyltransferase [Goekera deserti]NEL55053.1 glycosyltransferase family 2 protein [Goekera deserti]
MSKIPVTAIILTKNEEESVERVVTSCLDFHDVVVVDSNSADRTVEYAHRAGARTLNFTWNGNYPKKKEWSAAHSSITTDWVILLDADEVLPIALVDEIRLVVSASRFDAVDVPLDYVWQGRLLRNGHRVTKRIAFRRAKTTWPRPDDLGVTNMWEVEGHYQPIVSGEVVVTTSRMIHDDLGNLYDYFSRQNRYTDWEAWVLEAADADAIHTRSPRGRLAAGLPCKPFIFFLYAYFMRSGFRDGREGFDYALAHSLYYWQVSLKRRELRRLRSARTQRPNEELL